MYQVQKGISIDWNIGVEGRKVVEERFLEKKEGEEDLKIVKYLSVQKIY